MPFLTVESADEQDFRNYLRQFERIASRVVISRPNESNKVLLVKHENGLWLLPGGSTERREYFNYHASVGGPPPTLWEMLLLTADRELFEELNLPLRYLPDTRDTLLFESFWNDGHNVDFARPVILDNDIETQLVASSEIRQWSWFDLAEIKLGEEELIWEGGSIPTNIIDLLRQYLDYVIV